jgi:tyrosyl-DNA phosphodiesterase-1
MMILLRHDETAQVVIHTANMIVRDWTNMTNAVWLSPRLPLIKSLRQSNRQDETKIGSGAKFKVDLLNYLRAYDTRRITCKPIIDQLLQYDFSAIRGSLIASVPGRHKLSEGSPTTWGWAAMQRTLKSVPISPSKSEIAVQVSSIATLGPTDTWLQHTFFSALSGGQSTTTTTPQPPQPPPPRPTLKVIFPTPDEIRKSLDGYASGGSIHTKTQSAQQAKQLTYLQPLLHHWANDSASGTHLDLDRGTPVVKEAGRKRAAPHIKTYIRFGGDKPEPEPEHSIDWALLTSANLSKQAWGEAPAARSPDEMRIASYEIGVLVWPGLYGEGATMQGAFLGDGVEDGETVMEGGGEEVEEGKTVVVALRMPYNLPLQAYGPGEVPWVATADHLEPDWRGQVWRHG